MKPDRLLADATADELRERLLALECAEALRLGGPVGVKGQRDPAYPCHAYLPGKPGAGDCESDGHYLCYSDPGCVSYKAPPPECPPACDHRPCPALDPLGACPDGKERS